MNRTSLALLFPLFVACSDPRELAPPGEEVASKAQRITQAAPDADIDDAASSTNALSLALLARHPDGNFIFSAYSVTSAASMLEAGARNDTLSGMKKALQQTLSEDRHHRAMNTLEAALETRGATAKGKDGKPFRLVVTNQLFAQKGQHLEPAYLDTLAQEYGSGLRLLDFSTDAARASINSWVGQRTEGKITDLFAPGSLLGAKLAVVNTLYFNAAWNQPFPKANTAPAPFTLLDGTTPTVSMMRNSQLGAKAAVVDGTDIVEILYDGQDVSLLIVAPPTGKFGAVVQDLDAGKLKKLTDALRAEPLDLKMPKFKFDTRFDLTEDLKALGMTDAFEESKADFSGMTGDRSLFVGVAVHQAIIILDESGTEAAAATGFGVFATSAPPQPRPVTIDRPFLFFIRDVKTGVPLFSGRVVNPN